METLALSLVILHPPLTHTHTHRCAHVCTCVQSSCKPGIFVGLKTHQPISFLYYFLQTTSSIWIAFPSPPTFASLSDYLGSFFKTELRNVFLLKGFPGFDLGSSWQGYLLRAPTELPAACLPTETRRGELYQFGLTSAYSSTWHTVCANLCIL